MGGLLSPRTGTSEWKTWPIVRAHDRVALGGTMFAVASFKGSGPWWFDRDSLTILVVPPDVRPSGGVGLTSDA
jgi:hypothetical protein